MKPSVDTTIERIVERLGTTFYGKYRGTVEDIDDPENMCRIRAAVPAVLHGQVSQWAMPSLPFAGNGHGFVMLPRRGSGVWIEFEGGDLRYPIWSGGWVAEGQRPQPQGDRVRVIVSDRGHTIALDDEDNEIRVKHSGGASITMSGSSIVLTVGAAEVKLSGAEVSINRGMVKITAAGVSLVHGAFKFGL